MPKSTFTPAYATLIEQLVAIRHRAGVSQVELSKRLGKVQPFVSNVERGLRRLDVIEFYAILRALGADPEVEFSILAKRLPKKVRI